MISALTKKIRAFLQCRKNRLSPKEVERLRAMVREKNLKHVAIAPDGNRRWARAKGLHAFEGHKKAISIAPSIFDKLWDLGVHTITFSWISPENFNRGESEVMHLMHQVDDLLRNCLNLSKRWDVKIIHMGRKDRLPAFLLETIQLVEQQTKMYEKRVLNVAIDYGTIDEVVRAFQRITEESVPVQYLTPELFLNALNSSAQPYPEPDLIIRFGKVYRLSGFMLLQGAYSELYFPHIYFPDCSLTVLRRAIEEFSMRKRTFGANAVEVCLKRKSKISL